MLAIRGTVWMLLTVALAFLAVRYVPVPAVRSVGTSASVVAAAMTWSAPVWRRRRGLRKRTCEFLAGLLLASGVVWLVLPVLVRLVAR